MAVGVQAEVCRPVQKEEEAGWGGSFDVGFRPKIQEGAPPDKLFERTDPDSVPPGQLQEKMILLGCMAKEKTDAMTELSVAENPPDHAPLFPDFRNQSKGRKIV